MVIGDTTAHRYAAIDPDVRLMLLVREDDAGAFEELVARYQDRLIAVLEHLVRGQEQAEDLAQEVFLRVFRARKRYKPGAKFSTWLFTIANNVASNALRRKRRRKEIDATTVTGDEERGTLDELAAASSSQMPARQLDRMERAEMVQAAVGALGERQRLALLLAKFEGLSYEEIGQVMDLSPQAVKSLLSRARRNLRDWLEPYMQSGDRPSQEAPAASERTGG